jgi:hypothetical protein
MGYQNDPTITSAIYYHSLWRQASSRFEALPVRSETVLAARSRLNTSRMRTVLELLPHRLLLISTARPHAPSDGTLHLNHSLYLILNTPSRTINPSLQTFNKRLT